VLVKSSFLCLLCVFEVSMRLENSMHFFNVWVASDSKVVDVLEDLQFRNAVLQPYKLTLFAFVDGIERLIAREYLFGHLSALPISKIDPLIIRTTPLRIFDMRRCLFPLAEYGNVPAANITSSFSFLPEVLPWVSFTDEANRWLGANDDRQREAFTFQPSLVNFQIVSEVPSLQSFLIQNAFKTANKAFSAGIRFDHPRNIAGTGKAFPDYLLAINRDKIGAPVEIKGQWSLSDRDILQRFAQGDPCVYHAIMQLYSYMKAYHRKYGILSSYQHTWSSKRRRGAASGNLRRYILYTIFSHIG
jgi:hypothetical protein